MVTREPDGGLDWVEGTASAVAARLGIDADSVRHLIEEAPRMWLAQGRAAVAADLALVAKPLTPGELRVRLEPAEGSNRWELTVVVGDRVGLLGATASTLARFGLSVVSATAVSWVNDGIALQRIVVDDLAPSPHGEPDWPTVTHHLRAALASEQSFAELGTDHPPLAGTVSWSRLDADDREARFVVAVRSSDAVGLLGAVAYALADNGANVEVADVRTKEGVADDRFVVRYAGDPQALTDAVAAALGLRSGTRDDSITADAVTPGLLAS